MTIAPIPAGPTPGAPTPADPTAAFLQRLRRGLRPLSDADRSAIVAEIEAHIADRLGEPGAARSQALAGLGDPDTLARAFLEEHELARALSRSGPGPLLAVVLARASRSAAACLVGFVGILLYVFAASFAAVAVLKPVAPRNVGLWTGPRDFGFGVMAFPGAPSAERLGLWIVPLAVVGAMACYLLATGVLRSFGGAQRRRGDPLAARA